MADPKTRSPLRVDTLDSALEQKLTDEAAVLDVLVAAMARGQAHEPLWEKLHQAAQRDDRLAELAFAYERLSRDKKLKSMSAPTQAAVLGHAGAFFADVFGDPDGAEGYLERALSLAPGDVGAFEKYEQILSARRDLRRLGELYAAAAPHRGDRGEQLRMLRCGAELVDGDPERALKLNLEILRLDPTDDQARKALEDLYEKTGRLADLAKLLEQSLAHEASPAPASPSALALRVRLLALYTGGLGEIERSLPHVEEILRADAAHEHARRVAEELLGHKALTARVASALAAALEASGEPGEAARVIGVEIEATRGPKRLEAQKKLARLTLEQLGDLEKAFALDEAILPQDPADEDVRARFVQLASALDKQLEATRALTRAGAASRDPATKARISADLGDLFRELSDAKKARAAYQAVLDARADDEASLRAARALAALGREPRDPRGLALALARLAEIEPEEDARLAATAELARLTEEELADVPAAIAAHERLLGTRLEADSARALCRLYEAANAFAKLAGVLDRLVLAERDPARARELSFRVADLRSGKLPDRGAALAAWQAYLTRYGASREALARLIPLLEQEKRWEELSAALAQEASLAPAAEQAPIYARLGQLRQTRFNDPRGALEAHRQALAVDPAEKQSRAAVGRLLDAGELRLAAADVLEPLARAEGAASTLVRVLEVRAALSEDPRRRLQALAEAAELSHQGLRDPRRATDLAARGLTEALALALEDVPTWVERIERLSTGGDAGRRASALRDALGDRAVDHPALALLARRAGEALVASGDVAGALAVLRRALGFEPSSSELLARVDSLLREQGSPGERLALYRAALAQASDPARRLELFHAIGVIERRDLGDAAAAALTYRLVLDESPDDRVAGAALLEIHQAAGAWEDVYAELARALARADRPGGPAGGAERAALLLRLAEVAAGRGWLDRAAAHYAEILAASAVVSDEILDSAERVARDHDDLALLGAVLKRRIEATIDPAEEATWLERQGELARSRLGDAAAAGDAFRRAASAAESAGDGPRAARLLELSLDVAPGDRAAAGRLLELYRAAEAWERLPGVYARLLRGAPSAAEAARVLLAFEAPALRAGAEDRFLAEADALLAREDLGDHAQLAAVRSARARMLARDPARFATAVAAYRAILEAGDDATGAEALALDALLDARSAGDGEAAENRRWLFAYRADQAPPADRAPILLAWAAAEEGVLGDPVAAAALYGRAIALDPDNDEALAAQARLLQGQGDFAGARGAVEKRRALAAGPARSALDLELAALLLDRLDQPAEALATVAPVLEARPGDAAARALVERALSQPVMAGGVPAPPAARRQAAEILARAADAAEDNETFASLMGVLLATPADDATFASARRGWFERVLDRPGLSPSHALDVALLAASELPSDLSLWDRAEPLARAAQAPERLALVYRRALGVAAIRSPHSARPIPEPASPEIAGVAAIAGEDADTIEEIGRRAFEYHEEWFDEPETAIALLRRIVELVPGSAWSFERLKLVYNLNERWGDLFALYDGAIARADSPDARRDLLEDAALAAKDLASDSARAMRYYEALYALKPEPRVRTALERLYERHGRHQDLIALLTTELGALDGSLASGVASGAAQKLRSRIAQLWLDGAGDAAPAVAMVEQMLDADPAYAGAFELLERVLARSTAGEDARRRAGRRLSERYRAEGRTEDLVRVLEMDLDAATTPGARASLLRAIVKLRLDSLHDEAGAFDGTAALLALEPSAPEHRAELGRLAARLGRPARLAEALSAAAAVADGTARIELLAQAADVYETELGDTPRAIEQNRAILGLAADDDPAALAAARRLDRLLRAQGEDRIPVLERLAAIEPDQPARRAARQELSRLALEAGDVERATRTLRAALAEDPADEAAEEGLAGALEGARRWEDLVSVLAARAARGGDDARVRADRVRAARLLEAPIGDVPRAIDAWMEVRRSFGADDESTDALAALLEQAGRFSALVSMLEGEATAAPDDGRAADLWRRIGDLYRTRIGNLDEAVAAYDLALEQRPADPGARSGLEALLAALDIHAEATRRTLGAAVASLSRLYGAADDHAAAVALLEPRLAAAASVAERVSVLTETAAICERRAGDPGGAFEAIFRAFSLSPSELLATRLTRLADLAERWGEVREALSGSLGERADVPRAVRRELFYRVALWQRDGGDPVGAEASLMRALAVDPSSEPLLEALADVQRRAPNRALVDTLRRLAAARGGDLDLGREAVEVIERLEGAGALSRELAEALLGAATRDWSREGASAAAAWAIEALARFAEAPAEKAEIFLRGARLPFGAAEQRQLRLAAAELAGGDAAIVVYEQLFAEEPDDPVVSSRLEAIYRSLGRTDALLALRERQIAAEPSPPRRVALRLDLARLRAESGDHPGAITALLENLDGGLHAPSAEALDALYEAGGHDAELVALCEHRAAAAEQAVDPAAAVALWGKAAGLAEGKLGDVPRAVAAHRRASALGAAGADEALARLLTSRGDHAGAAEVLDRICERTPPERIAEPVLRLVDALRAAGRPGVARSRLERAARSAPAAAPLRERLAALYKETGEWRALAHLIAEGAFEAPDRAVRAARLREAAEIYLVREGDPAAAIPLLEQAAGLLPDDTAVHLRLASARRATGDLDQAAETLRSMLAAYGARRPKERAVVHFELAQVSLAKGDRTRAVAELDAALRIDPAHPEILQALARLSFEEGQLERAARTYRALLLVVRRPRGEDGPNLTEVSRAEVLFELCEIARLRGETERAAEQLESAFEAARESDGERDRLLAAVRARGRHDLLARALEARLAEGVSAELRADIQEELATLYETHLGRTAEALDARLAALALAPPSPEALHRALELSRRAGQVERVVAALSRLCEGEPDEGRATGLYLALGRVLEHDVRDDARAAAAYRKAEALAAQSGASEHEIAAIWHSLADVYGRLGDFGAQEALLERRLGAVGPGAEPAEVADATYQLAALRLRRPEAIVEALSLLDRAYAIDPQPDRSEALLREALSRVPDQTHVARALEHLARVTGRDSALVDALVVISEIDPEGDAAAARLEPLVEAVAIAERLGDAPRAEALLRRAVARAATLGDAPLAWALLALSTHRAAAGDLAEAAALRERAARAGEPDRERALLLEVAGLAAGPLADPARAARLYEELRAREPAEREIWQPLAEVYRRLGDRTRLAALLEDTAPLLEGAAERGRLRLERARMAIDEDQDKAVALLKDVIEDDPSLSEAAVALSELLEKLGRRDELAELIRRQLDAAKDREDRAAIVQLSLRLGAILEQQWDEQGALDAYHAALDWDPKSRDLLRQIVRVGMTRDDSLSLGDALSALLSVEEGEDAVDLALRLARIRGEHGDPDAAAEALEHGWAARPGDARLRDELSRHYTASGAWSTLADLHVRDADTRSVTAERVACLRRAADLLREHGEDPGAAAEILRRALDAEPGNREVLAALIDALGRTGQHALAVSAVGLALAVAPDDAELYRTRASFHEALGRDQAALLDLEQAYEKSGGDHAEALVSALTRAAASCAAKGTPEARAMGSALRLRLAAVLAQAGQVDRARAELTAITSGDARDRSALRALALLEEASGDWDAASAIYGRLIALEEGGGLVDTALRLADACERGNRLGDAREALERARRAAPDDAAVRERLRDVYSATGAGRELSRLLLEDATRTADASARFGLLLTAGRLLFDAEGEAQYAVAVFEEARSLRPDDPEATLLLADAYTLTGRLAEARAVLDAAVAAQKGRRAKVLAAVYRRLARLDLAAGDNAAALAALTRAFDNEPQNAQLAMELGTLAVEVEEHEPATRAFRAVTLMKIAPAGSDGATAAVRGLAYYHLGRMAFIQGDRRKARLMIDKAVADDPSLDAARALLDQLRAP